MAEWNIACIDKKTFFKIFEDNWGQLVKQYSNQLEKHKNWIKNVEKMFGCGNPENGSVEYYCPKCDSTKKVGFPCRSRLCPSCSRRYVKQCVNEMRRILFQGVTHRHVVLTIPDKCENICANN